MTDIHPMPPQIIVCDDDPHILYAVSFKLCAAGFDVVQANNGREAIEWIESHTPDLVITDYQMPLVDGLELCNYLRNRAETADVPIVLLTARALELSAEEIKERWKIEAVLTKPYSPRGLLELVRNSLSRRAAGAPVAC